MGRIPPSQTAALDILDWLYFNQVLVWSQYSAEHLLMLIDILDRVKLAVAATGATDVEAEIMKHYVLCLLEIWVSDVETEHPDLDNLRKWRRHNKTYFSGLIIGTAELIRKRLPDAVLEIVDEMRGTIIGLPAAVRYRLAERCLALEYSNAAHEAFVWFVRANALPCSKYQTTNPTKWHEIVVIRIGLLCEFELARRTMRLGRKGKSLPEILFERIADTQPTMQQMLVVQAGKLWSEKHYGPAPDPSKDITFLIFKVADALDQNYVLCFLNNLHKLWRRPRLLEGTAASWPAILGAFNIFMKLVQHADEPEYTCALHNEVNNEGTLSSEATNVMKRYGVTIFGRSIAKRYRDFEKQYTPFWLIITRALKPPTAQPLRRKMILGT